MAQQEGEYRLYLGKYYCFVELMLSTLLHRVFCVGCGILSGVDNSHLNDVNERRRNRARWRGVLYFVSFVAIPGEAQSKHFQ